MKPLQSNVPWFDFRSCNIGLIWLEYYFDLQSIATWYWHKEIRVCNSPHIRPKQKWSCLTYPNINTIFYNPSSNPWPFTLLVIPQHNSPKIQGESWHKYEILPLWNFFDIFDNYRDISSYFIKSYTDKAGIEVEFKQLTEIDLRLRTLADKNHQKR